MLLKTLEWKSLQTNFTKNLCLKDYGRYKNKQVIIPELKSEPKQYRLS